MFHRTLTSLCFVFNHFFTIEPRACKSEHYSRYTNEPAERMDLELIFKRV